jgi:hypothetical protein
MPNTEREAVEMGGRDAGLLHFPVQVGERADAMRIRGLVPTVQGSIKWATAQRSDLVPDRPLVETVRPGTILFSWCGFLSSCWSTL